jgi:DNA-binding NarL/FixJ family response regulator
MSDSDLTQNSTALAAEAPARPRIRVMLADDHSILMDSLVHYLSTQACIDVVATVNHGDAVISKVTETKPAVLVMDLLMPGLDPYQRLQQIKRATHGQTAVLVLTSNLGEHRLTDLLREGARGYLPKDADGKQLVAAIQALSEGGMFLHTQAQSLLGHSDAGHQHTLSKREFQLLTHMSKGLSNKEIASKLFLSTGTVKSYSSRLFDKLGVRDRTQAVLHALKHSLLPKEPA